MGTLLGGDLRKSATDGGGLLEAKVDISVSYV